MHVAPALDRKCEEVVTTGGQANKMAAKQKLATLGLCVIRPRAKYLQTESPIQ